ncbi:viral A-type inclusion protein [Spirosoma soli]|uniref:Viral A-type inclusion protein n=1 Tax=Spirosoma soli TaxID=1770529 RepID=A0ABW5M6W8_9BACT
MFKFFPTVASFIISSLFFLSCKSDENKIKDAENEVFAIHDEVMPKIDDVMKLRKQLRQRITSFDSLKVAGSAAATLRTDEDKEQAVRINQDLALADSLMMDWMSRYNGDTLAKLPSEEALRYLTDQKDKITDVKTKVNTSIQQARQFLGKN